MSTLDDAVPVSGNAADRIVTAALALFIEHGFDGTSTDQIAARAATSKRTVYKHFGDKAGLLAAVAEHLVDRVDASFGSLDMSDVTDADVGVRIIAETLAHGVMDPAVLGARRVIIAEAARFPTVGETYWNGAFQRVLHSVGAALDQLRNRGLLDFDDAKTAADHLAGLILWLPVNRAMMTGRPGAVSRSDLDRYIAAGVDTFLSAHGT